MTARGKVGALAVIVVTSACGGRQQPRPATPEGEETGHLRTAGGGERRRAATAVTAAGICRRISELEASGCELVRGYGLTTDECVADQTRSLEERGSEARTITLQAGGCFLGHASCDDVTACFEGVMAAVGAPRPELRACHQTDVYAAVGLATADWDRRKGAGVRQFSQAASTKEEPVEVCGIPSEMTWLLEARCDDGSNPFSSGDQAHAARVGNVGAGGRCGSIVDLYEVACPEGTHAIYFDAYVCPVPPGQPVP